ncbi:MAG TPA: hypothetical protein VGU43_02865 [Thermoplasmata archaeon]|nr:hypothetical protein [Thermoplasmata archaeon]
MAVPLALFAVATVLLVVVAPDEESSYRLGCCPGGTNRTCCAPSPDFFEGELYGLALLFAAILSLPLAFAFRWSRRYRPLDDGQELGPSRGG